MNEQTELPEQTVNPPAQMNPTTVMTPPPAETNPDTLIAPQGCAGGCNQGIADEGGLESVMTEYIYAVGNIEARFPNLSAEKEFAQAAGREITNGKTDQQTFHAVLSKPENRYLLRQLCWVFTIQGMETYLLIPRDQADIGLLLDAIRPAKSPGDDIDVVIGMRGPVAPPEMCNGLMVPIVAFDQIYSFGRSDLIGAIPKPQKTDKARYEAASEELFDRIMQMADNAGATDEHRNLNYLLMRYTAIYEKAAEQFGQGCSLTGVEVRPSPRNGTRNMVDTVFSYTNRNTDFTEKFFVRVDVTEEFPFLVTKMSPYYDR